MNPAFKLESLVLVAAHFMVRDLFEFIGALRHFMDRDLFEFIVP